MHGGVGLPALRLPRQLCGRRRSVGAVLPPGAHAAPAPAPAAGKSAANSLPDESAGATIASRVRS